MVDVRDGSILLHMNVQPVLLEVLGHHLARRDDTVLLWQIGLCKCRFVVAVTNLLSYELVGPFLVLASVGAGDTRDYERHLALFSGFPDSGQSSWACER